MDTNRYISERTLEEVTPNGEKINILVAVGVPYKDEKYDSWACPVKAEGMVHKNLSAQRGIDSWQTSWRSTKAYCIYLDSLS